MKAKILNKTGSGTKEVELPKCFSSKIRKDIAQRYYEVAKKFHMHGTFILAGMQYSASGKLRHRRHKWKSTYGRGISRVPRKIFWRRGTQFYWQGATVAGTVGGRKAHPPKIEHFLKKKKINQKEIEKAISSAISATANSNYLKERYSRIKEKIDVPFIVSSDILKLKTKEFKELLKKVLKDSYKLALQEKSKRAGRGKTRGRKYKKSAGLLLVIGNEEKVKFTGIDVKKVNELEISDLWPLGRLAMYTEKALEDLDKFYGEKK